MALLLSLVWVASPRLLAQSCQLPGENCTETDPGFFKLVIGPKTFSQMILDGDLLPASASISIPQFLFVCGQIIDDVPGWYYFAAGSELVFLDNTSGVQVNSGSNLRFTNSYLHGCDKLWDRVRVQDGALAQFLSLCRVEDAYVGVHLEPGSAVTAVSSRFDGNYIHMYAGGAGSPNQHSVTAVIHSNQFRGQKTLIEPVIPNPSSPACFFSKPMYGIITENVRLSIGVGGSVSSPNSFSDYSASWSCSLFTPAVPTGILSSNSTLNITNSRFVNIANGSGGRGISFGVSTGASSTLNFTGLGKTGSPTFDNVQTGIYGLGNMNVRNSRFQNMEWGVYLTGIPAAYNVNLSSNKFERITDHSVFMDQSSPINRIEVLNSDFTDDDPWSGGIPNFPRSGVHIRSFVPGNQQSNIFNNDFVNDPKAAGFIFGNRGVWIRNLNGGLVEQNRFTDNYGSSPFRYEGANVFNASTRFWSNHFTGAGNWATHPSVALQIQESPMSWLNCNMADQTAIGWEFQGNCSNSNIERNWLNTHNVGLLLRMDAVTGPQSNKYNRWIGNASNIEALFEGRDPFDPIDQAFIFQSRFRVHTPDMSTDFWPDPRFTGPVFDLGVWFALGSPANVQCIASAFGGGGEEVMAVGITEADEAVMEGRFVPVKGYEAGVWEAEVRLFQRLAEYPELRPAGSDAAQWYAAHADGPVGRLGAMYAGVLALSKTGTAQQEELDAARVACEALNEAIAAIDEAIAAAMAADEDYAALLDRRAELSAEWTAANAAHEALIQSLRNSSRNAAADLLAALEGESFEAEYAAALQEVFEILLRAYLEDAEPTGSALAALRQIAGQCRYSGGLATVLARAACGDAWDWSAFDECPEAAEERAQSAEAAGSGLQWSPNPAQDRIWLRFDAPVSGGWVILRDVNSREVQRWELRGSEALLRWHTALPNGVYLLDIRPDAAPPQVHKLHINR